MQEWADSFNGLYPSLNGPLMREMFPGMPEYRDGFLYLNENPGIGVDIDEALAARPCRSGSVHTQCSLPPGTRSARSGVPGCPRYTLCPLQSSMVPGACSHVEIRDVNVLSRLVTGDGIDIVGCRDVLVEHCFIRAADC